MRNFCDTLYEALLDGALE
jgi:hypothetical protein